MALNAGQESVSANKARHLIFFSESDLAFNYKTGQWTRIPAYQGLPRFTINDPNQIIGLVTVDASNNAEAAGQGVDTVQVAQFETGAFEVAEGYRGVVRAVRPLVRDAEVEIEVGTQDFIDDAVEWSDTEEVQSRTGQAYFRCNARYHRVRLTAYDFETVIGVDIDAKPHGKS